MSMRHIILASLLTAALTGCQTTKPYDYSAFKQSNPRSILVVQPSSSSVDVKAPFSVLAQATHPLAESGYYVFPVALANETFKQNGLTDGKEIQSISLDKIQKVFNPDAILYLNIRDYGTKFQVINSKTIVSVEAKLLDAKTGKLLWEGKKSISEDSHNSQNYNLLSAVLNSVIAQIQNKVSERAYIVAGRVNHELLSADPTHKGLLYGPYNPQYQLDSSEAK